MTQRADNLRAVLWSAALHGGILGFLALATLPCGTWEGFFGAIGLPPALNPVQCTRPTALAGEVIEATLIGKVAAPRPKHGKPKRAAPPPPPVKAAAKPTPKPPPVKTLPPPPKRPAVKDQQKVVALAAAKAEQARKLQQQRERQRQAELEAEQRKADKLLQQLAEIKRQRAAADKKTRLEQQRLQQLADLKHAAARQPVDANVPPAAKAHRGQGGSDQGLAAQYAAALTSIITQNWLRPDNTPVGVVCPIHIVQIPGGQVISAKVLPSCPFDESARKSVENAVLRAQPLPYKGYERVFSRDITLNFKVEE